ncbi:MAG: tape measure protein [Pseudomonas oryzihabitans]|uniref:tape measure protein n=1 Tax=Pseudomonas oryzihabitans TaxID=47885 RepID=UPI0029102F7C|nr:tape measure protein [Pseudomonas oryzihabitans]MDU4059450.1 tape measure protein [Pseudomonas oryzihabitans]
MADENIQRMLVQIEATTAGLRRELDKGENKVKQFAGSSDKSAQSVDRNFSGMASSVGRLIAPLTAAVAAFASLGKLVETQRQFDRLNAGLITATGSSEKAALAFEALQDFAAKTPYSLDQAVEGFSKLVNLGLTPSEKALTSYGNTAAAMGKDLNQMIEAVADAATGEFERLKEFGITSSQQGDKVSLTFRGVTTTIGKSAKEIEGYLMNLGLVDFAGAMDERAKTLDGQISNLGDTWDKTYRLINQQGLGDAMSNAVGLASDALTELNMQLESGQFEGYMAALGESVHYYGEDFKQTLAILESSFSESMEFIGIDGKNLVESLKTAFLEVPETLRSYIQRIVVEFASGFDRVIAYGVAFKDSIAAVFNDDSFSDVQKRLEQSIAITNQARQSSIEQIEIERSAAVKASEEQVAAADARRKKYDEERAARASDTKDRLVGYSKQVEAAKTLSKEEENKAKQQAKALADLLAQSKISTDAANALADAYLNGQDLLAKFTLQEKISQELLKTGAAAREKVTAAIEGQLNAEARRDVAKATYDLRAETSALDLQAAATLQGKSALEAFNVERAKAAILSGKNVDALTEETRQYLEAFEANQKATKALQQAGEVEGIMDRLQPQAKLLKDYTKEVAALTKAMELDKENSAQYAETLRLLGLEYEQNRVKATAWGQFTEGAVDRVDEAFADAWKNIGKGFDGFATSLKDGFKQLLAELAHMAITKPIIMQIGAAMGVGGLSASQNGGMLGIGGSGSGGMNLTDLYNYGTGAYKFITGTGANLYNAYSSGGMTGVYNYGANALGNAFSGANTAATGATQAGYTGSQFSNWVAAQNTTWGSAASSFGAIAGGIGGAIQGYQTAGIKGAIAGGVGGWGGATLGTMAGTAAAAALSGTAMGAAFGSIIPGIGTVIGAALGAAFGSKLFGGAWETKDAGLTLGVEGGDLSAQQYEYQKKKGGLFSKNKKRTRLSAPDEATQAYLDTMYDGSMAAVEGLFEQFGITISEGAIDGLQVATTQISTKGKSDEEVNTLISQWFDTTFDSITNQLNVAMGSQFREGLTFAGLQSLLTNLVGVNAGLEQIHVTTLKLSPASAYAADALRQFAGGMEQFGANVNSYYQGFFSQTEREDDALAALRKQFEAFNLVLPDTREQYRKLVESMDVSYDAGQKTLSFLLGQSGAAASVYDVLERRAKEAADAQQALADAQSQAAKAAADAAAQQLEAARQAKISYADAMQQAYASDAQRAMSAITSAIKGEQDALTESYNAQVDALNARISASSDAVSRLTSMTGGLSRALRDLLGQSDAATAMLYQQGRATLESAAAIAKAGGSLANFEGLDQALDAVTGNSADRYGNWEDFARDQGRAANLIDELNKAAGGQLSVEQRTLETLKAQLDQGKSAYDAQIKAFQGQIDLAQQQLETLNGINGSVLSVKDALAQFATALGAAYAGQKNQNEAGSTASLDSQIGRIYSQLLGRNADAGGLDFWKQKVTSGALSAGDLQKAIAAGARDYISVYGIDAYRQQYGDKAAEAALKIPAFANGGEYAGGLAMVGERGPEIINFQRPGYVYTARESAGMLSSADLSGMMALLRQLLAAVGTGNERLFWITDNSRKTATNTEVLRDRALQQEATA